MNTKHIEIENAEEEYVVLLWRLHKLIDEREDETENGEDIRSLMDDAWDRVEQETSSEKWDSFRAKMAILSEAMYNGA